MKKVVISCESSSFGLKEAIKAHLEQIGYEVTDLGQQKDGEQVLYFTAAERVAKALQSGEFERGIVCCARQRCRSPRRGTANA